MAIFIKTLSVFHKTLPVRPSGREIGARTGPGFSPPQKKGLNDGDGGEGGLSLASPDRSSGMEEKKKPSGFFDLQTGKSWGLGLLLWNFSRTLLESVRKTFTP